MKQLLKKSLILRTGYSFLKALRDQYGLNFKWTKGIYDIANFLKEYKSYVYQAKNTNFSTSLRFFYPCLTDKTTNTPIEPTYFFQDTWAAGKVFQIKPQHHYDVGSSVQTVGILSQFVPVTMVDIRPIELELNNLHFKPGSILNLPFQDSSVESLSSLCVVEHIGLGRYGDPIDSWGSEKAIEELKRVLKLGGNLLFSVPVDEECRVYFNAHRAFTREYILELFQNFNLIEERYIYGTTVYNNYDKTKGFGTGLFYFTK